jgi:hypothetical protein
LDLFAYITSPESEGGLGIKISRMTLHRYRTQAEAARIITTKRCGRHVRLLPGRAFPAELATPPAAVPVSVLCEDDLAL